jgi:hypothetical protein
MKQVILISFYFHLALLLASCNFQNDANNVVIPEKQLGIPQEAFWIGGSDGGAWFIIDSLNSENQSALIKIYNDNSGDLIESRYFKLSCTSVNAVDWNDIKNEIDGFDGHRILLKNTKQRDRTCYFE